MATKILPLQGGSQEFFDRLLEISPFVAPGPEGHALVHLGAACRYWKLPNLPQALASHDGTHPFLCKIRELSQRFEARLARAALAGPADEKVPHFVLAPTAPWAHWLLRHPAPRASRGLVEYADAADFRRIIDEAPLPRAADLIPDLLSTDGESIAHFHAICENLSELGARRIGSLRDFPAEGLVRRFGPVAEKLLKRLHGSDTLGLDWYQPPQQLSEAFYPQLEKHLDSDRSGDILVRLKEVLQAWEERLRTRKSLLRGLQLRVRSDRRGRQELLTVTFPKATRDSKTLHRILEEKWTQQAQSSHGNSLFEDEIERVEVFSLGLSEESDRQLCLFDPHREDTEEQWNQLIGRLQARATKENPIEVGAFRPFESYWPEASVEWVSWGEGAALAMVAQHPRRPAVLLREPELLAAIPSEGIFWQLLEAQGAFESLERIRDPWRADAERTYARLNFDGVDTWIFWDHQRRRAFLHGFFEAGLRGGHATDPPAGPSYDRMARNELVLLS